MTIIRLDVSIQAGRSIFGKGTYREDKRVRQVIYYSGYP